MEFLTLKRHLKKHLKLVTMSSCSIRAIPLYITCPVTVPQVLLIAVKPTSSAVLDELLEQQ